MEEFVIGLFWGVVFATPTGYFLRSAVQWRREARDATRISAPPPAPPHPAPVAGEVRMERLLDRLSQRMETLEDRIDFTERLLDSRGKSGARVEPSHEATAHSLRDPSPQR
jgi:hypothetical protein